MSYNPTQWSAGDTVTSAKLNKIEQGISNNGVLKVHWNTETKLLDKTLQEIYDADLATIILSDELSYHKMLVVSISGDQGGYYIRAAMDRGASLFYAQTVNDYPVWQEAIVDGDKMR